MELSDSNDQGQSANEQSGSAAEPIVSDLSVESSFEGEDVSLSALEQPELKRILGAMLFGSREPLSISEIRGVFSRIAESRKEDGVEPLPDVDDSEIREELNKLSVDLESMKVGVHVIEAAGGFRFVTDSACGPWLRELLNIGKPPRLSRPALETLAIIAFRQPVARAEIEAVRGVSVDSIVRSLLDAQLVRIVGRSELPGRPMLYGTTPLFLKHFGLKDLRDLPCLDELGRRNKILSEKNKEDEKPDVSENSQADDS